ncbi:MAG: Uncharacterised protein [Flavobacteriaceae bacterium]|nr:MAG: Uncharacterised protein [Flavobacteriaceae bacterium]
MSLWALGIFSEINNTSFPAIKAARSISPGLSKFAAPFMFNASVKTRPLNPRSFCKISVTIFFDKEEGKPFCCSSEGTFK